jgi:O-antigen/teichoic acid export membrane protein
MARSAIPVEDCLHNRRREFGKEMGVGKRTLRVDALALLDQAVVSGTSFLTAVVVGRSTSPSELGLYALGMFLLVPLYSIHEALIINPYTILQHRPVGTRAERAGSALVFSGLLSTLTLFILLIYAVVMLAIDVKPALVAIILVCAAVTPFLLLREFARRFSFAHLELSKALKLDIAVAATQFAAVGGLAYSGRLSSATALAAIGTGCGLTACIWLYVARGNFVVSRNQIRKSMQRNWSLGKWLFATQLAALVERQFSYWALAWILGTAATGIFTACWTVALIANPVVLGLSNIRYAQMTLALEVGGLAALQKEAMRSALVLGVVMTMFFVTILLTGDDIIRLLYGDDFVGYGHIVTRIALTTLVWAIGAPACNALSTMEHVRVNFYISCTLASLSAILVFPLVNEWGLMGLTYLLLVATICWCTAVWVVFLVLARAKDRPRAVNDSKQIQDVEETLWLNPLNP